MKLIKNGIARTIQADKVGAYKAAGWVEVVQPVCEIPEEKPKKRAKKGA